jgi:hypothetical protein
LLAFKIQSQKVMQDVFTLSGIAPAEQQVRFVVEVNSVEVFFWIAGRVEFSNCVNDS